MTGHILLAIGIATSLLAYMFLNSMSNEGGYEGGSSSNGYGDYRRNNYRSRRLINKVLFIIATLVSNHHFDTFRQVRRPETLHNYMAYNK